MTDDLQTEVLIVGAGIAGLMAARRLADFGVAATVFERSDVVGGRMATVQMGPGLADYGAQFFTVRTPEFGAWVDHWLRERVIFQWGTGFGAASLGISMPDGHPCYAAHGGMRALAEHLAHGLDVSTRSGIVGVTYGRDGGWQALDENGCVITARALIMTVPAPLALRLLDAGEVEVSERDETALRAIAFAPTLAGLFWIDGAVELPEPGAVQRPNAPITWIADNRRKGLSPRAALITVHAGPAYSRELWHMPDWEVLVALESGLRLFRNGKTAVVQSRLDRWLYATPVEVYPEPCLVAEDLPPLAFAGDAFGGPRLEGAALSGLASAEAVATRLRGTR